MSELNPEPGLPADAAPAAGPTASAERKRLAARRRFLRGGATGVVIVTIAHQRSAATTQLVASSTAACASLTGHRPSGRTVEVSSPTPGYDNGRPRTKYVCD
jgi:hypothetical protein